MSGNLDQSAQWACDDLANYMADGAPEDGRSETLLEIARLAQDSEVESIVFAGRNLANVASEGAWESGADLLAGKCMEEGWEIS